MVNDAMTVVDVSPAVRAIPLGIGSGSDRVLVVSRQSVDGAEPMGFVTRTMRFASSTIVSVTLSIHTFIKSMRSVSLQMLFVTLQIVSITLSIVVKAGQVIWFQ
jgi:hypothetical protein